MISNQPYKNNESTNKDELSEDSADRESVEITRQKLNEDHKKTITPIELAPKFQYNIIIAFFWLQRIQLTMFCLVKIKAEITSQRLMMNCR